MGIFDRINSFFAADEDDDNPITVDLNQLGWTPDANESILVAHGNCKIMKNGGKEIGEAFGKVHFITQEASSQRLVCCVTNKRILLIPQDNKEKAKTVFSIGNRIMGVDWVARIIASSMLFNNWLEYSVKLTRDEIVSAELSENVVGNIVVIKFLDNITLYLSTTDIGHSMDIATAIMQPGVFME